MAPILPGISDKPELLADVVKAARDAGASSIWTNVLYLRPGTREHFLDYLARDWPELMPMYQRLYAHRAYLGKAEVEPVRREVAELRNRFAVAEPVRIARLPGAIERAAARPPRRATALNVTRPRAIGPVQLSLDALVAGPQASPTSTVRQDERNRSRGRIVTAA
jgi:DNA repair photolyase